MVFKFGCYRLKFICLLLLCSIIFPFSIYAQNSVKSVKIYEIQGSGASSKYVDSGVVSTEGVVTLTLLANNQIGGFFIQDTLGDQNPSTSDGIFVYHRSDVKIGDYITLESKVNEYNNRTQLTEVSNLVVVKQNVGIPYTYMDFPIQFPYNNKESVEGMALAMDQTFYLTNTSSLKRYGEIILSSKLLRSPTDAAYPKSEEYYEILDWNQKDNIMLDDGSSITNPNPIPFTDEDGTCRTGRKTDTLRGVYDQISGNIYALYPHKLPVFYGNSRSAEPNDALLGDYNLKVCGFNIENYLNGSELQKKRIVKAITAIDADLIGLCEVIQNKEAMDVLVRALNNYVGEEIYSYIPWITSSSKLTTVQIVYKKEKLEPYKNYIMLNAYPGVTNRRLFQGFVHKKTGFKFIFSVNHLKAKSGNGTGNNADQGDGQGIYNYQRVQEANAVVSKLKELVYFYGSNNILCVGDYNAFAKEDPIKVFNDAGYYNQIERFSDSSYTYHFGSHVEYLDYSLANDSMARYVTSSMVWHINADEPSFLDYEVSSSSDDFLYRSSDHDPVIVGLKLPQITKNEGEHNSDAVAIYPQPAKDKLIWNTGEVLINSVEIYNNAGLVVKRENVKAESKGEINIGNLPSGSYIARFISSNGIYYSCKLIKQ